MTSWKKPTTEEVEKAVALLAHHEHQRYFFERLNNPEWLESLDKAGFFNNPPPAKENKAEGTISFPTWPQSRFLARMAKEKPDQVKDIILKIPDTNNVNVYQDFIEAALAMPAKTASKLLEKTQKWSESNLYLLLPEKIGTLIVHYAKGGEIDSALKLAVSLFEITPDPRPNRYKYTTPQPRAKFDGWMFNRTLEKVIPALVESSKIRVLYTLCDLVNKYYELSRKDGNKEDYSYISQPNLQSGGIADDRDLESALITTTADTLVRLVEIGVKTEDIIKILKQHDWKIFLRLELFVLNKDIQNNIQLISEKLTNKELFEDRSIRQEYFELLENSFALLGDKTKEVILGWIEEGPDVEALKKTHKELYNEDLSQDKITTYIEIWQRDKLAWIVNNISPELKRKYENLKEKYGDADKSGQHYKVSAATMGPTSPKNSEELGKMTIDQIVQYITNWKRGTGGFTEPSPEGLGRELQTTTEARIEEFSKNAEKFIGLESTYVRSIIQGFTQSIKSEKSLNWQNIIKLCEWILTHPESIGKRNSDWDQDPDWNWARRSVVDLIRGGLRNTKSVISFDLRTQVWDIIKILTNDSSPIAEEEKNQSDWYTLAINTTRGAAMEAVIEYGLWVRRKFDSEENPKKDFSIMPEVKAMLEDHLDIQKEKSLAIRSVYGAFIPWIILLDESWSKNQIKNIFPSQVELRKYFDAAWEAYLSYAHPYDNVLLVLKNCYLFAVKNLKEEAESKGSGRVDPQTHLVEHLVIYFWRNKISLESEDQLIKMFWDSAPIYLKNHAVDFVGRSLYSTKDEVPSDILSRLQSFWKYILENSDKNAGILSGFGWWFISNKFDFKWATQQMLEVMSTEKYIEPDHFVIEYLMQQVENYPAETLEILGAIIKGEKLRWGYAYAPQDIKAILIKVAQGPDSNLKSKVEELAHLLGTKGLFEMGDLANN